MKTDGDSFMATFTSPSAAVECAIALQRAFAEPLTPQPPLPQGGEGERDASERVSIRIGLNAGEPIEEDDDLFGTDVPMAARIMGQGAGGEVLVPEVVRTLVAGKGFVFTDRGEVVLKGFEDAVRLYEVRWREDGA